MICIVEIMKWVSICLDKVRMYFVMVLLINMQSRKADKIPSSKFSESWMNYDPYKIPWLYIALYIPKPSALTPVIPTHKLKLLEYEAQQ